MIINHDEHTIDIRQSWLDAAMRCPERGRQSIIRPEWDAESGDAALCGTGMHGYAEARLQGGSKDEAFEALHQAIDDDIAERGGVVFKTYRNLQEVRDYSEACAKGWERHLFPKLNNTLNFGHPAEVNFTVDFMDYIDQHGQQWRVRLTGTADYPTPSKVWDWKSAGDKGKYKQREKQKHAVQPTVYLAAAVRGAFGFEYRYPAHFTFGVVIRPSNPSIVPDALTCDVWRGQAHENLLRDLIYRQLVLWDRIGLDEKWPLTMENNWLCSAKWCPWYSICRGAHLSPTDDMLTDEWLEAA